MRQAEKKKGKDRVAAVLMLCFCVIALTSVFTIKASIDKISKNAPDVPATTETPTEQKADTDETEKPGEEPAEASSAEIPTVDSRNQQTTEETSFILPIDMATAKVSKKYSMDMVIYNQTLDQYMTHPGIDFEAPTGSGVKAVADGTITDIYNDDAYGITIEITHKDGYISRYCCLSTNKTAEKGDTVKKGQVISNVGKSALYESMEKTHLHFEMLKNGKLQDPSKLLPL